MLLSFSVLGIGTAVALDTKYDNSQSYDQTWYVESGYDNQIPYKAFFMELAPTPEKIKVQRTTKFGQVIQAEIPINQTEENVEQKGLE